MKDNKYYTPSIEEFHVGFEYEYHSFIDPDEEFKSDYIRFIRKVYENDSDDKIASGRYIRVKYLDKKDIEECGFSYIENQNIHDLLFIKDNKEEGKVFLHFYLEDSSVIIFISDSVDDYENYNLFHGVVNNKSELKRLLKQLGIND